MFTFNSVGTPFFASSNPSLNLHNAYKQHAL